MGARVEIAALGRRLFTHSTCPAAALRPAVALPLPTGAVSPSTRPFGELPRPSRPAGYHLSDLESAGGPSHLHELIHLRHQTLGGLFAENIQGTEVVFVAESGAIREVLQKDSPPPQFLVPQAWTVYNHMHGCQRGLFFMTGARWQHHRRIMNRYMLRPDPRRHQAAFDRVLVSVLERWQHELGGNINNTEEELYTFSVQILAAVLFGDSFGWVGGAATPACDTRRFAALMRDIFTSSVALSTMDAAAAARDGAAEWCAFENAVHQGLHICRTYVEGKILEVERQLAAGQPAQGIIAEIMEHGEDVSREDLVHIVADLFLAAGDTTAHSTQWTMYQVGRDARLQQRLLADVRKVAPAGGALPTARQLDRAPLVKAVVKESLRMYPVAPFLTRLIQADTAIGGYRIPAGTPLCISLFTSSRDERYFSDPLTFRPERWLRLPAECSSPSPVLGGCPVHGAPSLGHSGEEVEGSAHSEHGRKHRYACMPFASGVRGCIGKRVAELQMQLLLAGLVHRCHVSVESQRPAQFIMRMVGVMSEEVRLRLRPRDD